MGPVWRMNGDGWPAAYPAFKPDSGIVPEIFLVVDDKDKQRTDRMGCDEPVRSIRQLRKWMA
jgi:hypothetical protein